MLPDDQPLSATGLIAILRGLTPAEAPAIGETLYEAGFRRLEVPLNSPEPFDSISQLTQLLPADALVGGGTVVRTADVDRVHEAGGRLVVAPNTDPEVIARALELGMEPNPGVATATEVFAALHAGARALKIFPAPSVGSPPAPSSCPSAASMPRPCPPGCRPEPPAPASGPPCTPRDAAPSRCAPPPTP